MMTIPPQSASNSGLTSKLLWPRLSAVSQAWVLAFLVLALGMWPQAMLSDADSYWHIAAGAWMLDHHTVAHSDPFSFSLGGKPWISHEWGAEVSMALIYRIAGWPGLMLMTAMTLGATALIMARWMARYISGLALWVSVCAGLSLIAPHYLIRPHIWVLPLLALWVEALLRARAENRAPPLWQAVLILIWVNMHGSFFIGMVLIGPFALEAILSADPKARLTVIQDWALFGLASLMAALGNAHGIEGLIFPIKLILMPAISGIAEWQPADLSRPSPFILAMIGLAYGVVRLKLRLPVWRGVILIGLIYLTLQHERQEMILGIVGAMLLVDPLSKALAQQASSEVQTHAKFWPIILILGVLGLSAVRLNLPAMPSAQQAPIKAVNAVPMSLRQKPVLNDYDAGGYLIFKGIRPFIDGRTDLYGSAFMAEYFEIEQGHSRALDRVLKTYPIAWSIQRPQSPLVKVLDHHPDWRVLYRDASYVVHVRKGALP